MTLVYLWNSEVNLVQVNERASCCYLVRKKQTRKVDDSTFQQQEDFRKPRKRLKCGCDIPSQTNKKENSRFFKFLSLDYLQILPL